MLGPQMLILRMSFSQDSGFLSGASTSEALAAGLQEAPKRVLYCFARGHRDADLPRTDEGVAMSC